MLAVRAERGGWVTAAFWVSKRRPTRPETGVRALGTPQVARLLGVSEVQVRWLAHRGQLTVLGRFGPVALYPMSEVLRMVSTRERAR